MRLVIGLFKVNTQTTQNLSAATRVENVISAVKATERFTGGLGTGFFKDHLNKQVRAVFLAPEYCFARSLPRTQGDHSFGSKRQMEEDYVKERLRPAFSALSKNFQNALIVPGTVAWRKSIVPADKGKHANLQAAEQHRRQKYEQRIQATADINLEHKNNAPFTEDTPVFPTDFKSNADTRPALPTAATKVTALQTAHYIAKNTAHCYYNGECIYKYNKIGDFYEVSENTNDTVMVPNRGSDVTGVTVGAGRFSVSGWDVGISVCYDQSLSVQSKGPVRVMEPLQKTEAPVDLHILLSAHISPETSLANLKDTGLLLSCSSADQCNGVLIKDGRKFKAYATDRSCGADLDFYVLEW